jgi:hypothetical protein
MSLEETIRKAKYLYEHKRGRSAFQKAWDDKKKVVGTQIFGIEIVCAHKCSCARTIV